MLFSGDKILILFLCVREVDHNSCEQSEQRKQDSTDIAEVQEAISEALVV